MDGTLSAHQRQSPHGLKAQRKAQQLKAQQLATANDSNGQQQQG